MELQELYELMERFAASGLTELEWKNKDGQVVLRRELAAPVQAQTAAPTAPAPAVQSDKPQGDTVSAPLVGVFYAAPAPGEKPFVQVGQQVKKGETLCLIEAMKMMSEVPAPADCVVEEVLAADSEAVGFGQPLFRIRKV